MALLPCRRGDAGFASSPWTLIAGRAKMLTSGAWPSGAPEARGGGAFCRRTASQCRRRSRHRATRCSASRSRCRRGGGANTVPLSRRDG
eukprot:13512836-Alexandrium_andersonii.AAC.1